MNMNGGVKFSGDSQLNHTFFTHIWLAIFFLYCTFQNIWYLCPEKNILQSKENEIIQDISKAMDGVATV